MEFIAAAYFEPDEHPLVLEIDTSSFLEHIEWLEPTANNPWKQPLANISNLPCDSVVKVYQLVHFLLDGKNVYKFEDNK